MNTFCQNNNKSLLLENNSEKSVCVCVEWGLISERLPGEGGCNRKTTKLPISESLEERNPIKPLKSTDCMKEKGMTEIKSKKEPKKKTEWTKDWKAWKTERINKWMINQLNEQESEKVKKKVQETERTK